MTSVTVTMIGFAAVVVKTSMGTSVVEVPYEVNGLAGTSLVVTLSVQCTGVGDVLKGTYSVDVVGADGCFAAIEETAFVVASAGLSVTGRVDVSEPGVMTPVVVGVETEAVDMMWGASDVTAGASGDFTDV